jgi:hypothetical protein
LTLCHHNPKADDNIQSFLNNHRHGELTQFEIIDINRIERDYIDFQYKPIKPTNPLEYHYHPEESVNSLTIERLDRTHGNHIKIDKPYDAYLFLVKPKTIYELFNKFGFSLFFRNVRNPLLQSDFNPDIAQTILDNPSPFWYYNNGIIVFPDWVKYKNSPTPIGSFWIYVIFLYFTQSGNTISV